MVEKRPVTCNLVRVLVGTGEKTSSFVLLMKGRQRGQERSHGSSPFRLSRFGLIWPGAQGVEQVAY